MGTISISPLCSGVINRRNAAICQSGETVADTEKLNDCNQEFQVVAGLEESGFSSLGVNTNAFLQVFTQSSDPHVPVWGRIRLLGAPEQGNPGIVSTFTDPTGALQKQDFSKVGQAVDFVIGVQANFFKNYGVYSFNPIFGVGFTTPLNSQDVVLRYQVPDLNAFECQALFSPDRFGKELATRGITRTGATCLTGLSNTAIQQIAFSNQDRSNFLGKWGVGIRTITRFKTEDGKDPERGVVDVVFGQDATLTGGSMSRFVLKIDGVHPLPFSGESTKKYVYLFGSAGIRLTHNKNLDPLILQTVDLTKASPAIPSPEVLVLPLKQSNRDFYRIGVGLNIKEVFTKLFTKQPGS
jgi:hypothetical protein